jgi:hypothetical protein
MRSGTRASSSRVRQTLLAVRRCVPRDFKPWTNAVIRMVAGDHDVQEELLDLVQSTLQEYCECGRSVRVALIARHSALCAFMTNFAMCFQGQIGPRGPRATPPTTDPPYSGSLRIREFRTLRNPDCPRPPKGHGNRRR